MKKLALQLVMWNGEKYLPYLLASIEKQEFKDFDIFILDNNSQDNSIEICNNYNLSDNQQVQLITNKSNLGFAGGHNKLFEMTDQYEYILLVNQDLVFEPDCFKKLVNHLDNNKNTGAVSPRLMKWENSENNIFKKSNIIDSLGTKRNFNWSFEELSNGEIWENSTYANASADAVSVLCVSGTAPMYRRSVVDKIKYSNSEVFDKLFISYKEDIDIGLRIKAAGFDNKTILDSVAYHDRTAAQDGRGLFDQAKNKQKQANHIKYNSYKNHIMLLAKFFTPGHPLLLRNSPCDIKRERLAIFAVLWYELGKFVYYLVSSPRVLLGWGFILKNILNIYKKRRFVFDLKKQK